MSYSGPCAPSTSTTPLASGGTAPGGSLWLAVKARSGAGDDQNRERPGAVTGAEAGEATMTELQEFIQALRAMTGEELRRTAEGIRAGCASGVDEVARSRPRPGSAAREESESWRSRREREDRRPRGRSPW